MAAPQRIADVGPDKLEQAFPSIPCNHRPFGQYVIVQTRLAKTVTAGGILLTPYGKEAEKDNTQVAKVVAIGPGAFRNRHDGAEWPEGPWFRIGDFVRCPKYGGDRWDMEFERTIPQTAAGNLILPASTERGTVEFALFKDLDLRGGVDDPLQAKAYL